MTGLEELVGLEEEGRSRSAAGGGVGSLFMAFLGHW